MHPTFFSSQAAFRKWLQRHHQTAIEIVVGFYKVHTDKPTLTWPQSVDEALCFGWIDGVRSTIDADSYQIRFTPRKAGSIWSAVNIKKVAQLIEQGLMQPAGMEVFNNRKQKPSGYSHESGEVQLLPGLEKQFKANKSAWKYFQALAPSYRKASVNWVMGARQEATREKRLQTLISDSAAGTNMFKDNKYKK
ncbi:YdeI/OmpD-associated family protein [Taibaiella koreensis]|uniref:YdeI/OmpD-associated family protein n=1 Tax=Taibaiella koreensis TaxID=1268548 RepID=UPI000E59EEA9|nr:YdeI/OmpD-associated family protein [Taibaiella koreensis]